MQNGHSTLYVGVSSTTSSLTKTIELVQYEKLGTGQNATVVVMSYSGYDIEDAIVMNKSSLDHGFGHCIVMKTYSTSIKKYMNRTQDRIVRPAMASSGKIDTHFQILDNDGIATPGEIIRRPYKC
jgi:DNA-directed RNA polymerase III subunit RPC2